MRKALDRVGQAGRGTRAPGADPSAPGSDLLSMRPTSWIRAVRREPFHFWALCFYYFIEYVRPQVIYPALDSLPLGRIALLLTILGWALSGLSVRRVHSGDLLFAAFAVVLYLSGIFAVYPEESAVWMYVFVNWALVYVLTTAIVTTPRRMIIFLALFLLWSFKLSQFGAREFAMRGFGFTTWGIMGPQGWFQNSGELAIQMCVFVPMAVMFVWSLRDRLPRWAIWAGMLALPGTGALTVVATSSRGGQLGLAAAVVTLILFTRHRVRGLLGGAVVLAALWSVLPDEQVERFRDAGEDETSVARMVYWEHGREIIRDHPILGIGYRNWLPYYRSEYNPRGELPHNILVEAGAELGLVGLAAFLALAGMTVVMNQRTRRLARGTGEWGPFLMNTAAGLTAALVGFLVSGMFVTVLYYPYFWINFAITAALFHTTRLTAMRHRRRAIAGAGPPAAPSDPGLHSVIGPWAR